MPKAMLERLLRRIEVRGVAPTPLDSHHEKRLRPASIWGNSGYTSFPILHLPVAPADLQLRNVPSSFNVWQGAVNDYLATSATPTVVPSLPAPFAHFGDAHAAIAQLLWERYKSTLRHGMHILGPHTLIAVLEPMQRQVWVRRNLPTYSTDQLAWQEVDGSPLPAATLAHQFDATTQFHLLWFYGQTVPEAVRALPSTIGEQALRLRRFPPVESKALELRHLAMLRLFSYGPMPFSYLLANTKKQDQDKLVADVASFYFTGALAVAPLKG
jgi:hypothetical protein